MKEGKQQYAIDLFNISLKFDPDFVETHIAKACTYMAMVLMQAWIFRAWGRRRSEQSRKP